MKKEKRLEDEITDLKEIEGIQKEIIGFFGDVVEFWTKNVKTNSYWHEDLSKRMDIAINGMKEEERNFVSMVKSRQNGE